MKLNASEEGVIGSRCDDGEGKEQLAVQERFSRGNRGNW